MILAHALEQRITLNTRHADVEHHASGFGALRRLRCNVGEERLRRGVQSARVVMRFEEPRERIAYRLLVVHDLDQSARGSHSRNSVPGRRRSNQRRPPCACTMVRQIDSPMPIPSDLVVKKGTKMRSASLSGIPGPKSRTDSVAPVASASTEMTRRRRSGGDELIASMALRVRFSTTCCSMIGSAQT